eukprot:CAMPEP_0176245384 /NCGR_PEP_ID=MMETSP0121_2-20121125/31915_1 /TAXON_ID=160619 /ORGANISM="Kryptoperidinium foliaceum, Strain CCMP 1326" /LENGTH=232 /DNA_ID=CAMNT_0017585013 /DNA_START=1 /DNA_END=699 /DNA_ORIENTATION=+
MKASKQVFAVGYAGGSRNVWFNIYGDPGTDDDESCYPNPFMDEINRLRCLHAAPAMTWDAVLATKAVWHSGNRVINLGKLRNAFFFGLPLWTAARSVNETYRRGTSGKGMWAEMYSAMLWGATSHIGCGQEVGGRVTCFFRRTGAHSQLRPKEKTDEECGDTMSRSLDSSAPLDAEEERQTAEAIDRMEFTEGDAEVGGSAEVDEKSRAVGSTARGVAVSIALGCAGRFGAV